MNSWTTFSYFKFSRWNVELKKYFRICPWKFYMFTSSHIPEIPNKYLFFFGFFSLVLEKEFVHLKQYKYLILWWRIISRDLSDIHVVFWNRKLKQTWSHIMIPKCSRTLWGKHLVFFFLFVFIFSIIIFYSKFIHLINIYIQKKTH